LCERMHRAAHPPSPTPLRPCDVCVPCKSTTVAAARPPSSALSPPPPSWATACHHTSTASPSTHCPQPPRPQTQLSTIATVQATRLRPAPPPRRRLPPSSPATACSPLPPLSRSRTHLQPPTANDPQPPQPSANRRSDTLRRPPTPPPSRPLHAAACQPSHNRRGRPLICHCPLPPPTTAATIPTYPPPPVHQPPPLPSPTTDVAVATAAVAYHCRRRPLPTTTAARSRSPSPLRYMQHNLLYFDPSYMYTGHLIIVTTAAAVGAALVDRGGWQQ